jgi:hypothetical protein
LPFPIYNAIWYDNKALWYYNYISGGRNGGNGVEGGGVRNCYADPVITTSSHTSGMCSSWGCGGSSGGDGGCGGGWGCGGGSG